jgi:predicted component of type VI protein secretion system
MTTTGYGWQKEHSVQDWLIKEPYRFEFYQAVRLIEAIYRRVAGELASDDATFLRFRSRIGFDFPASEIQAIDTQDAPVRMTVNFLGLAGALGPLPAPYSEMIMAATARKDFAAAEFLDIFNHRLVWLLYRVRQAHDAALTARSPHEGQLSRYLFSIVGLGPKPLRNRLGVPDRTLLHYAGLLGRQVRSAVGLVDGPRRPRTQSNTWRWSRFRQARMGSSRKGDAYCRAAVARGISFILAGSIGASRTVQFVQLLPWHKIQS